MQLEQGAIDAPDGNRISEVEGFFASLLRIDQRLELSGLAAVSAQVVVAPCAVAGWKGIRL